MAGRKPLIIRGARQVGKTFAVRVLGETFENLVEVNFELRPDLVKLFDGNLDPKRIVRELELLLGVEVRPGKTLLFFDELQQAPKGITALRYFYELMPGLHVIAAGSLLDFAIEKIGVPVGRVEFLHMYPLSMVEFLEAMGDSRLAQAVAEQPLDEPIGEPLHGRLLSRLGEYLALGGLPEVVRSWAHFGDPKECQRIQGDLVVAYRQDFQKYATRQQIKYVDWLFDRIPHHLGTKFQYASLGETYRKRELAPCLDLLVKAGIVHRVFQSAGNGVPIGAEARMERFKLVFIDVGLAQAILGLDLSGWFADPTGEMVNKGDIVESFVGQELLTTSRALYYWHREARGSQAEVDYLIDLNHRVIPMEVKAGDGRRMQSLERFLDEHPDTPYGIRLSTRDFSQTDKLRSLPLYATNRLQKGDDSAAGDLGRD